MSMSRRAFLVSSAATAMLFAARIGRAYPLGLPLGLQLYSVRDLLQKDFAGTLKQVGALGYTEVEAAGFYDHPVIEVQAAMKAAGLRCVSAHYSLAALKSQIDGILTFCEALGVENIVCSSPMNPKEGAGNEPLSLDGWKWNADQFDQIADKVQGAAMHFAYHNHTPEFVVTDGVLPYDELLTHTDPAKVSFEMDCGWLVVSGQDPVHYLKEYPTRFIMLHIKDFKNDRPPSVELGTGSIDYAPIFAAAKGDRIRHCFVEQEESQGPMLTALAADARYMRGLNS